MSPYVIPGMNLAGSIVKIVSEYFGIPEADLKWGSSHLITKKRYKAMWLMREILNMSFTDIGCEFSDVNGKGFHYSVVKRGIKSAQDAIDIYEKDKVDMMTLLNRVSEMKRRELAHLMKTRGKLNIEDVNKIRSMIRSGAPLSEIAKAYKVSRQLIDDIMRNKKWVQEKSNPVISTSQDRYTNISGHLKLIEKLSQ